jgi:hypothetical protein
VLPLRRTCQRQLLTALADEFLARSPDELSLRRGDRIELIERDDDFGDGWFLGKNTETGENGLFPEGMLRYRRQHSSAHPLSI